MSTHTQNPLAELHHQQQFSEANNLNGKNDPNFENVGLFFIH